MEATVYNQAGKETGKVKLPDAIFNVPWNGDLVHQVVVSMQANARTPVAHTKDRGEVRGGGKKPWRQKGTGRARHGSRRSPIWIGGGITFGPRNDKQFAKKINKKMRAKALYATLSRKLHDGEVIFLDSLAMSEPKTKEAKAVLTALSDIPAFKALRGKKKNAALIALPEYDTGTKQSFRNIGNVSVEEIRNLNPVDVLSYKYVVVADPKKALAFLSSKFGEAAVEAPKKAEKTETVKPKKTTAKKAAAKVTVPKKAATAKAATRKAAPKARAPKKATK